MKGEFGDLIQSAADVIIKFMPRLGEMLTDAKLAGFLSGAGQIQNLVLPSFSLNVDEVHSIVHTEAAGSTPEPLWQGMKTWQPLVENAVHFLQSQKLVTKDEYVVLEDTVKAKAFTTVQVRGKETIEKVHTAIIEAVQEGDDYGMFRKRVNESLVTSSLGPGSLEAVFRTETAKAYAVGADRILEKPLIRDHFPFRRTVPIKDSRLSELCAVVSKSGLQGTGIYFESDPTWQKFRPPRHVNCRCTALAYTVAEAANHGIKIAQRWRETGEQPEPTWVPIPSVDLPPNWVSPGI